MAEGSGEIVGAIREVSSQISKLALEISHRADSSQSAIVVAVVGGLAVLVTGQIIVRSIIDPIFEVRKMRGEIADGLIFYADFYMNPEHFEQKSEGVDKAIVGLRSLGSRLMARFHAVPFAGLWSRCRIIPSQANIEVAIKNLIGLSNNIYTGNLQQNEKRRRKIVEALKLKIDI